MGAQAMGEMLAMKCSLFLALVAGAAAQNDGNITIMGDIDVSGAFRTTAINSETVTIDGSMAISLALTGESITVTKGTIGTLITKAIAGPEGSVHFSGVIDGCQRHHKGFLVHPERRCAMGTEAPRWL